MYTPQVGTFFWRTFMRNRFKTYDLAVAFYHSSQRISISGALREQLNRAAPSIVLNLAEGSARNTVKDQIRFFHIALGSLRECQAILELALDPQHPAHREADVLGAHLFRLIEAARLRAAG
jgi:four helix bundle protein